MKGRPTKRVVLQDDQREELKRLKCQSRKKRGVAFRKGKGLYCVDHLAPNWLAAWPFYLPYRQRLYLRLHAACFLDEIVIFEIDQILRWRI